MICAVIPALDEEGSVADVVRGVRRHVNVVVVADNGSSDATAARAAEAGAEVVREPQRGYGAAVLAGVRRARQLGAEVILFLDADGSDDPEDAPRLLAPVMAGEAEMALGVRASARVEPGSMTPVQRFGNWFAPLVMRVATGARYRDLSPFKAIRADALEELGVGDRGHGYTIELLLAAHGARLRVCEVEVACRRRRAGASKVSGTLRGTVRAAGKILWTIGRHSMKGAVR
jgi:glycosyltransferase involved in cell wall biosynthesis